MKSTEKTIAKKNVNDEFTGRVYTLYVKEYCDFRETDEGEECYNHAYLLICNELNIERWYKKRKDAIEELHLFSSYDI